MASAKPTPNAAAPGPPQSERTRQVELILSQVESLPTLSPIATRLLALTGADDSDFDEIVSLIEADISLTSRILALCRRASLGVAESVTTVKRAVVLLGLEAVQSAVLSVSVFDVLSRARSKGVSEEGERDRFDRVGFWKHSVGVACCAELLARQHPELKVRPDEAFTAGLVHDLGKIVLDWVMPASYTKVIELSATRGADLAQVERAILGVDHHLAGKRLAEHWGLPYVLGDAMWLHGQPLSALPDVPHRRLIALVTAADGLCRRLHLGWSGNGGEPPSRDAMLQSADLESDRVETMQPLLLEAVAKRCADLGIADDGSPELLMQSISAANERLHQLTQTLARRAAAARRQAGTLELMRAFLSEAQQFDSVESALIGVGASFGRLIGMLTGGGRGGATPAPPVAIVFQSRAGDPWLLSLHGVEAPGCAHLRSAPAPDNGEGRTLDLASLAEDSSMGAMADLLGWLMRHLAGSPVKLNPRKLRRLMISPPRGPTALILHDCELPALAARGQVAGAGVGREPPAERSAVESLVAAWGFALSGAARQQGVRRLSETLVEANRAVVEAQHRLTQNESLARLGELTAGAAHEMNNPLTIISGRSQLLAARLREGEDRDDAAEIAAAAGRLTDLITSLHLLAKPPAPEPRATNLTDLIEQTARRAKDKFSGERGRANADAPPVRVTIQAPIALAGIDPGQIGRAIEELVLNALQAEPRTGVEVTVSSSLPDNALKIVVKDDGAGMTGHALTHAFDPFFSEKPAGRRVGLGLSIARRFVTLHGGDIELRSGGPGRGAVAVIILPEWRFDRLPAAARAAAHAA